MAEQKLSRRDWFRLGRTEVKNQEVDSPNSQLKRTDKTRSSVTLADCHQQIPLPEIQSNLDSAELPPMCEAILDSIEVYQLSADLSELCE
ncbi:MAG: hypothetical protein R3C03_21710 [Pirellulaceae bacterium]